MNAGEEQEIRDEIYEIDQLLDDWRIHLTMLERIRYRRRKRELRQMLADAADE